MTHGYKYNQNWQWHHGRFDFFSILEKTKKKAIQTKKVNIQGLRTHHTIVLKVTTQQLVEIHFLKIVVSTI